MNCANHPDIAAVAYCRECGKPLCESCQRPAQGTVFCNEHLPASEAAGAYSSPYTTPPPPPGATPYVQAPYTSGLSVMPGLAFILGLIPGVGAIYNGQYAKGVIHVVILGMLFSIADSGTARELMPLFALLIMLWFFYMAFEAYHTASRRQRGEPLDEFSSIFPLHGRGNRVSLGGPILLIGLGVAFLLNSLELVRLYEVLRFWPVLLIVLGVYMLLVRLVDLRSSTDSRAGVAQEAAHER